MSFFFCFSLSFSLLSLSIASPHPGYLTRRAPSDSTVRQNQTIRWLDCHDRMTLAFAGKAFNAETTIFNGTLPDSFKCGEMDVPMDWAKPFDAETNHITIGFAMNRPKVSSGLLL
jgi:hypothetical protein